MYVAKVVTERGIFYNVLTGAGSNARVLNPEPFRQENIALMWMFKFSRKLCA